MHDDEHAATLDEIRRPSARAYHWNRSVALADGARRAVAAVLADLRRE